MAGRMWLTCRAAAAAGRGQQPPAAWIRSVARLHTRAAARGAAPFLLRPAALALPGAGRRWLTAPGDRAGAAAISPVAAAGGSKEAEDEAAVEGGERRSAPTYSLERPRRFLEASPAEWAPVYFELGKGKLSALVTLTAAAGFVVATPVGLPIDGATLLLTTVGTALSAMGASAFNQAMEIPNDSRMKRTARRPLVSGKMSKTHALVAASTAGASGVALLAATVNPLTAGLAASNIALYALVYTPMKQKSIWNTWVGAVVGAIPPAMGWAAVTGSLGGGAAVMGAMLFSWQIPHFLSLAYMMRADYKAGGYYMMPGDAGSPGLQQATAACLRHCLYLEGLCLLSASPLLPLATPFFALEATVLNAAYGYMAYQLHRAGASGNAGRTNTAARRLFLASLAYLPLLLGCMCLHRCVAPASADTACPYMEANKLVSSKGKGEAPR